MKFFVFYHSSVCGNTELSAISKCKPAMRPFSSSPWSDVPQDCITMLRQQIRSIAALLKLLERPIRPISCFTWSKLPGSLWIWFAVRVLYQPDSRATPSGSPRVLSTPRVRRELHLVYLVRGRSLPDLRCGVNTRYRNSSTSSNSLPMRALSRSVHH